MRKRTLSALIIAGLGLSLSACNNSAEDAGTTEAGTAPQLAVQELPPLEDQWNMIYDYCVDCHNETDYTGGLSIEYASPDFVHEEGEVWEKAIKKLSTGQMPPLGEAQPSPEQRQTFIASLEAILDQEARDNPNPGAPVLPRLNRTEYQNTIRDLLALEIDASTMLISDDSAEGFDNMSSALQISPTLLEGYVAASGRVAALAVGNPDMQPDFVTYRVSQDTSQNKHILGSPIGTVGGVTFEHYFPLDGTYELSPALARTIQDEARGIEFPSTLEITIDKVPVHTADFGGYQDTEESEFGSNSFQLAEEIDGRFQFSTFMSAGAHTISVNFLRVPGGPNGEIWKQHERTSLDLDPLKGPPHLQKVEIRGPFEATGTGITTAREKIFICEPGALEDEQLACANEILSTLARQAYRRPVTENEVSDLLGFYEIGNEIGGFEKGIETGIRRIISGPEFLFRVETAPAGVAEGQPFQISDLELASRLAFFLWSSIPDEELINIAAESRLTDPGALEEQVVRMLADPKAENLTTNFASQWFTLRNLQAIVPDPLTFPDYDDNLRQSSILETQMLFQSIIDEDRSILDVINADYTFVNESLAKVYGISGIIGSRMRRIEVEDENRRGVLGHSSILTLTSLGIRTSLVTRGKWFLTNLVGTPPPEPPADVNTDLERFNDGTPRSLRDLMELHRSDPVCSSCHYMMDTIGIAMENFDGIGRYRTFDGEVLIDPVETLFDGTEIDSPAALREWLMGRPNIFAGTATEKMMQFALARPLEWSDMPHVRTIVRDAAQNDYKFSSIIMGIVQSVPFQMRVNEGSSEAVASTN
ncbi:MAG: hypothetical protein COA71_06980 [SAR86 cluster bacterium]|uniref:DUF1592 domain-containing protein n=1 Tax=SAR86 cluster bacterium TaxID=2030880 RepID=A0A2A5CD34_9GAMM|nr:DUF1592 domain-containing protein [Gammaproteobacteria bacterium AH-315-E17]PCJ41749.1 MAG: hypothetical protein COA71_06980 [SAR86 cluster bacterium]